MIPVLAKTRNELEPPGTTWNHLEQAIESSRTSRNEIELAKTSTRKSDGN